MAGGDATAGARSTITHDNDGAFVRYGTVTDAIGLDACFCDPHSPWRRGGVKNANGPLRRRVPRSAALVGYSNANGDDITSSLDAKPRRRRGYGAPLEAFAANLGIALEMSIQTVSTGAPAATRNAGARSRRGA